MLGNPGDFLIQLQHPIPNLGGLNEPRANGLIDQWILAAVAMRVGVLIGCLTEKPASRFQVRGDWFVGIKNMLVLVCRYHTVELSALVYRNVRRDSCQIADILVILTVGRSLMNNPSAIGVSNVIGNQYLPGVVNLILFSI